MTSLADPSLKPLKQVQMSKVHTFNPHAVLHRALWPEDKIIHDLELDIPLKLKNLMTTRTISCFKILAGEPDTVDVDEEVEEKMDNQYASEGEEETDNEYASEEKEKADEVLAEDQEAVESEASQITYLDLVNNDAAALQDILFRNGYRRPTLIVRDEYLEQPPATSSRGSQGSASTFFPSLCVSTHACRLAGKTLGSLYFFFHLLAAGHPTFYLDARSGLAHYFDRDGVYLCDQALCHALPTSILRAAWVIVDLGMATTWNPPILVLAAKSVLITASPSEPRMRQARNHVPAMAWYMKPWTMAEISAFTSVSCAERKWADPWMNTSTTGAIVEGLFHSALTEPDPERIVDCSDIWGFKTVKRTLVLFGNATDFSPESHEPAALRERPMYLRPNSLSFAAVDAIILADVVVYIQSSLSNSHTFVLCTIADIKSHLAKFFPNISKLKQVYCLLGLDEPKVQKFVDSAYTKVCAARKQVAKRRRGTTPTGGFARISTDALDWLKLMEVEGVVYDMEKHTLKKLIPSQLN
ncbi:hypothetical protein B0H17DRAFT_1215607 [Mycena rosella]|uniref:Uncharacterized protein n=1 Tax=Mycena rosella TaxID=1033263 RepID=A0AAD7G1C7_MYCRO|nr:hypothetical protein B0H17DRAFT_1215607 [Mycena rosella]